MASVSELWNEFQRLDRRLQSTSFHYGSEPTKHSQIGRFGQLRAELLERIKHIPDNGGQATCVFMEPLPPMFENTIDRMRHENAFTAREMSAAYAFVGWELEQQAKEKEVGNG